MHILEILIREKYIDSYDALKFLEYNFNLTGECEYFYWNLFEFKRTLLNKIGDKGLIMSLEEKRGIFYEDLFRSKSDESLSTQASYLEKAIDSNTRCQNHSKVEELKRELKVIQEKIVNNMKSINIAIDLNNSRESIVCDLKKLSFVEAIIYSLFFIVDFNFNVMKKIVKSSRSVDSISSIFPWKLINDKGQNKDILTPLEDSDYETNSPNLKKHIDYMAMFYSEISGNDLRFIYLYIKDNFVITEDSFNFLVENNKIVPKNRRNIFKKLLLLLFQGELSLGYQVLVLQLENLFRYIAQNYYKMTYKLDNIGRAEEYTLWDILQYIINHCDENSKSIYWRFQCILCQPLGGNIRNNVAHGLVEEDEFKSGIYFYTLGLVILLLAGQSDIYNKYYEDSTILKQLRNKLHNKE